MREKEYIYILRVMATIAVIVIHVTSFSSNQYIGTRIPSVFRTLEICCRWAVPIFVMISGVLMGDLERTCTVRFFLTQKLGRLVCAFIFWYLFYILTSNITGILNILRGKTIWLEVENFNFTLPVHMWYLYMIISIYLSVPVIRLILGKQDMVRYFLIISVFFTFVFPSVLRILEIYFDNDSKISLMVGEILNRLYQSDGYCYGAGYITYFVLGWYLDAIKIKRSDLYKFLLVGISGYIFSILIYKNCGVEVAINYLSVQVLLLSVSVFMVLRWILDFVEGKVIDKCVHMCKRASRYCFAVYLVHMRVMNAIMWVWLERERAILFYIVCVTTITFIISYCIARGLGKIPIVKKYLI